MPAADVVAALPKIPVLAEIANRLGAAGTEDPGPMASAAELAPAGPIGALPAATPQERWIDAA